MKRILERAARTSDDLVTVLLVAGLLLAAWATDRIGVHPAIGAFLAGATVPRGGWPSNALPPASKQWSSRCCCPSSSSTSGCAPTLPLSRRVSGAGRRWSWLSP